MYKLIALNYELSEGFELELSFEEWERALNVIQLALNNTEVRVFDIAIQSLDDTSVFGYEDIYNEKALQDEK